MRIAIAVVIVLVGVPLSVAADPGDQSPPTAVTPAPVLPGASHAVLYEEDTSHPTGYRFAGSAVWQNETVSPGDGKPPELALRADIEIPERRLKVTWTLRRETESFASHTLDIMFKPPDDFPPGGILNVLGVTMKQDEQTRGVVLSGITVKVTENYFLLGLSNAPRDRDLNLALLRERPWLDMPFVYANKQRAILAVEKGDAGERALVEAFAAWK